MFLIKTNILFFCTVLFCLHSAAQCSSTIASFPFLENFETTDGGWTSGGTKSDWAWGNPSGKKVINTAAGGNNCWVVGGLTGSSYLDGEGSWIISPCYDFSTLKYPLVSFNLFWESELNYDGAGFQYSTDKGISWTDAGAKEDIADCLNTNWYNSSVRFLGGLMNAGNGWSGNIQTGGGCGTGNGSNGWLLAKKCLPQLAGKSSVIFRFVFGAGKTCNAFDGFAMDNFSVEEAPATIANFSYTCGADGLVNFKNESLNCPKNFNWDFGDIASTNNNTSTLENPSHIFSAGKTYHVTFTTSSPNNAASSISKDIKIIGVQTLISKPIKCFGDSNGEITAQAINATSPITYSWNTTPIQISNIATNLSAGTYSVTVTSANACAVSTNVEIKQPSALTHSVNIIRPGCVATTGTATITELGGTSPYTYNWFPFGGSSNQAINLTPQKYFVTVTDKNLCVDSFKIDVVTIIPPQASLDTIIHVKCHGGNDGLATAKVIGGTNPVSYSWNTNPIQSKFTANSLRAGNYVFTVTDSNLCVATLPITIQEPNEIAANIKVDTASCKLPNGNIFVSPTGNINDYQFLWTPPVSTTSTAISVPAGNYLLQLKNSNGCIKQFNNIVVPNIGIPTKLFLGNDTSICRGETIILSPQNFSTYLWQDNSTNNKFTITASGQYFVKATNANKCISIDTITVNVLDNCNDLYFPTSFSPNDDGLNDTFGPVGNFNAVSNYQLFIYNRWGQILFSTNNPREKWNGKIDIQTNATNTFTWYARYNFKGQGNKFKKGFVITIR